jgi:hypothetical protein
MILNVYKKFFNVFFCQSVFSRCCLAIVKMCEPAESAGAKCNEAFREAEFESLLE